jgi:predicted regulator of Ras-like GTPase activity (Roadblock/LC7/MglB family)
MDVIPSLWLSSFTGALLFFTGGRLWTRGRAEHEALAAERARDELLCLLEEERARSAALRAELAELLAARDEAEGEIGRLRAEVEAARAEEPGIPCSPSQTAWRPTSKHRLETAIAERLDELRVHEDGCHTAVVADMRGLLLASSGDTAHDDDLAAAASVTTDTTDRLRQLLPLGEPLEIRITDVNHMVFTARWLHADQDELFLSTFGVATSTADPRAAIGARITDLVRAT